MSYFKFQEVASEPKYLAIVAAEASGSKKSDNYDDEDDDAEVDNVEETIREKKSSGSDDKRKYSATMFALIKKYNGGYECETSDLTCLMEFFEDNAKNFEFEDKVLFKKQLQQLVNILHALIPSTSYLRGTLTRVTQAFKKIWVPKGEKEKSGPHMTIVHETVAAKMELTLLQNIEKDRILKYKLDNAYEVDYEDIQLQAHKLLKYGMSGKTKSHGTALLFFCELCCGARKGEFLDPHIEFFTYKDWVKKQGLEDASFLLGSDGDDKEVKVEDPHFLDYVMVQLGILKDKSQSSNKYLAKDKFQPNRKVTKPTIIFDSKTVVDTIYYFRKTFDINLETFVSRVKSTNNWSYRLTHPILKKFFPALDTWSNIHHFTQGTHLMRKIYANISYKVYGDQVSRMTNSKLTLNSWISLVLSHQGSYMTSLSYSNVIVKDNYKAYVFDIPPLERIFNLVKQVEFLQATVDKLLKNSDKQDVALGIIKAWNVREHKFTNTDGDEVVLPKRKRTIRSTKKLSIEEKDALLLLQKKELEDGVKMLGSYNIEITNQNLRDLGFGGAIVGKYFVDHPIAKKPAVIPRPKVPRKKIVIDEPDFKDLDGLDGKHVDTPPPKKQKTGFKLKPNQKIIAPQPTSKAAKAEALRRDVIRFGEGLVLQKPEDCEGTIIPNVTLGPKLIRDICED